jgi:hypothetical protein
MNFRQVTYPATSVSHESGVGVEGSTTYLKKGITFTAKGILSLAKGVFRTILSFGKRILIMFWTFSKRIFRSITMLFSIVKNRFARNRIEGETMSFEQHKGRRKLPMKNIARASVLLVVAVLIIIVGRKVLIGRKTNSNSTSSAQADVLGAKATQDINRDFDFPVKNSNGEKLTDFKYSIESAELRDQIIVQGQKATAVSGRTFLIINLKITNDQDKPITINTKDYIRLSVNGNKDEWLAPDIHNDPVDVQAISTKYTRVGFPVNNSDKNLVLRVGEIDGDKQEIELNLD